MSAPQISIVTTCKGRLEHLSQTLPTVAAMAGAEAILVDYDCPDGAGSWVAAELPSVKVVRVRDRPRFSVSEARNLGAAAATAPWLLFLDADVAAPSDLPARLAPLMTPGAFRVADPRPSEMCGAILVAGADYARVGGFDEAFRGWGSEDLEFLARLELAGLRRLTFPAAWFSVLWHDDALRTAFHEIADRRVASAVNALYCHAKLDLVRLGRCPDIAGRDALWQAARAAMERAMADGGPARLLSPLASERVHGKALTSALEYQFDPPDL